MGSLVCVDKDRFDYSYFDKPDTTVIRWTDVYWNEVTTSLWNVDIAFDKTTIYHNFHNEDVFKSLNQSKWD